MVDTSAGRLPMGTVRGDLHDIGKNLVCMMAAEGAGFQVKDIGVDQSVEKSAAAAEEFKPDIIGMSALPFTTTMTYMKTVIDGFDVPGRDHIKMAIGGAPISQMFADEIGADGYGADASSAVDLFLYLVGKGTGARNHGQARRRDADGGPPWLCRRAIRNAGSQSTMDPLLAGNSVAGESLVDDFDEVKLDMPSRFADRASTPRRSASALRRATITLQSAALGRRG